ncbi:MAG: SDR family oxidoreductase [Geminicoccaceae bacterium]|nr:SDR family oxidoreductase [Geminicoccaceae bacterium]
MTTKPLSGKVALVTGGARGIGRATAEALADMGADIAIVDIHGGEAASTAAAIAAASGVRAAGAEANVADEAVCSTAHARLAGELGDIGILVNNAGIMPQAVEPHHEQPLSNFNEMLAIHIGGAAHFSHLCIPAMRKAGFGRIVNLSSVLGILGLPNRLGYTVAKTGMKGLTRGLAVENARHGITVNAVAPGYILTDVLRDRVERGRLDYHLYAERTPVGRWGRPEEIARVIAFLAHPGSGFITGVVWPVDGGYTMRGDPGEDIGPCDA